jgi:DNA repair protein RadC
VGPEAVSTTELLACLLQTPDVLYQAQQLLVQFNGLPGLVNAADAEIMQINGIGPARAARIKAAPSPAPSRAWAPSSPPARLSAHWPAC